MFRPRFITFIFTIVSLLTIPFSAGGFSLDVYSEKSVLAEGRWIKISVDKDGLYCISASRLKSWGFSDPDKVVIRGYGGQRQTDILKQSTYIDDLPAVQTVQTKKGIVFYGIGSGKWEESTEKDRYYYQQNDYSAVGYYFVGLRNDGEEPRDIPQIDASKINVTPATSYMCRLHHEIEQIPVSGEAGPLLLGEDLRSTQSRSFKFNAPDIVEGEMASIQSSVISNTTGGGSIAFSYNGTPLKANSTDKVEVTSGKYVNGVETVSRHSFNLETADNPDAIVIGLQFTPNGKVSSAHLNYISVNYTRKLRLPKESQFAFDTRSIAGKLECGNSEITLWDVTDPLNICSINGTASDGVYTWQRNNTSLRTYAAFTADATFPEPKVTGNVKNQNLHAHSGYDMVIVSPAAYHSQAQRLARFHAESADSMSVAIVTPDEIYNEFSSGACDVGGIRRYFKMLYDRGNATGRPLRYAILLGRMTLDNRGISAYAPSYPTIPAWMPQKAATSLSDNTGFCSDDIMAMLGDGSGNNLGSDKLSIAIGRMPVTSEKDARNIIDKTLEYASKSKKTAWKHRFMFLADDEDMAIHLEQTENMLQQYQLSGGGNILPRKIYIDAYDFRNGTYPEARESMYRMLDEGVVWWNFIGHASPTGWTGEGMLSYSDLNSLYLRHWPFIYAATCDFLRMDSRSVSGGELLYSERFGGAIGMISAIRPVYISDNGKYSDAIARAIARTDKRGRILTPGEIYRQAKNDIRDNDGKPLTDKNRLRFVFVGDPALPLAMPSNSVIIESINGTDASDTDAQPTLAALQKGKISGRVAGPDGQCIESMNGVILIDIFDAERTITTNGRGEEGKVKNFEDIGQRIYTGSTTVKNGRFTIDVAMPAELSQNFRPAAMSLYAYSTEDNTEAVGLFRDFYVYGYDETVAPDTSAPVIESLVLNHSDFRSGDAVNESPMLIAQLRDDVGINISSAGVGHQLTAILDGNKTYTGLSDYYIPSADGSPSGVLNYPIEGLQKGPHTLALRVWDTSGNAAEKTIEFNVAEGLAPKIYDVYSDANPASTGANFYLRHNQPDNMVTVTVTVYNLIGKPVWSGTQSGRSDMFLSVPVSWDLCDFSGRRVGRGIYIYRATITSDGMSFETSSRRIAVTSR